MSRFDRLFSIILELQGREQVRADELAQQLRVSKRTIYRDILSLNEAGVPVISLPGHGYSLMPGYFLPPLRFSSEEAVMLLLGSDVTARAVDLGLASAAVTAATKISAVLSEDLQREVQFLRENLQLIDLHQDDEAALTRLRSLRQAITERRSVTFSYRKPHATSQPRQAEPHGLYRLNTVWLLAAFDPSKREMRSFRLDRMAELRLTSTHFLRQPGYRLKRDTSQENRNLTVRVRFDLPLSQAARDQPSYFTVHQQDTSDGMVVTLQVRKWEDLLPWLRSWGDGVSVLEPPVLRAYLADEARRLVMRHTRN